MKLRLLISTLFLAIGFSGFSQSIGLIGSATVPGGWDFDTNMVQSPDSAHLWSLDISLIEGACKFRQDNSWTINWGSEDYPAGIGTQGGKDIPIQGPGDFSVTFNSNTGAYLFDLHSEIGFVGDATTGGWNNDTKMFRNQNDTNEYYYTAKLIVGKVKFRANGNWDVNWGGNNFPSGVATAGGNDIAIASSGKYLIKFNRSTLAYSFTLVDYSAIGLIGTATPGLWVSDSLTTLTKNAGNPDLWEGNFILTDGEAKFRANHAWQVSWGDTSFPSGIGIQANGPNIKVLAGEYHVTFNTKTFAYKFLTIGNYTSMGIVGDATGLGWNTDVPMTQDANDKSIWRKRHKFVTGECKFRANGNWDNSWGASGFPNDTATLNETINIPVPVGEYKVEFNSTTGIYNFVKIVVFDTIGLIGNSIPGNNWDADVFMKKSSTNEYLFYIPSIDLLNTPIVGTDTGGVKFRANAGWKVNWGSRAWPTGIGTQEGKNILTVAGTYGVTLITDTGEYTFGNPINDTKNLFTAEAVTLSPNPANDFVNIATDAKELTGDAHIVVFNSLGARVLEQDLTINGSAKLNISTLKTGNYFVHISNGKNLVGKSLVMVR